MMSHAILQLYGPQRPPGVNLRDKVFFHFPFYPLSSVTPFLPSFMHQLAFWDWGLVTRWAQLLITLLNATYPAHLLYLGPRIAS